LAAAIAFRPVTRLAAPSAAGGTVNAIWMPGRESVFVADNETAHRQ